MGVLDGKTGRIKFFFERPNDESWALLGSDCFGCQVILR